MTFMDFIKSLDDDSNHAKEFKSEFEKLFDDDDSIEVFENLREMLKDWKDDCPDDENLVYADIMVNLHSYDESDIKKRVEDLGPLKPGDMELHPWFLSSVMLILAIYLNDDLKELYSKSLRNNDLIGEFSQRVSQVFTEDPLFLELGKKSPDNEELRINTQILHVTVYSKYAKYSKLKCSEFAEEFEKILFTSYNNDKSENILGEFRLLSDIWKRKCPEDANMACAYIVAYLNDLSDEELEYYVDLANNGKPVDESRNFILKRSMIGALNVRNDNTDHYKRIELDCRDYAKKFKELYEKVFNGNGNDSDSKELADLMFSWDLKCPDDANMILARTLLFHSALSSQDISSNLQKVRSLAPIDEDLYPWFLTNVAREVLDEENAKDLLKLLIDV